MRLDHSLESRKAYEQATPIWPPPDLELDFGKIARSTRSFFSSAIRRIGLRERPPSLQAAEGAEKTLEPIPRRSLTIREPLFENQDQTSRAGQLQSPLFRLPLKIRQEIYRQVLGNSNIHIVTIRGGRQLRHMRCKCATCPGFASYIERGKWRSEWTCDGAKYSIDTNRVPAQLLRTCRDVYSEAIELLYSSNVFSFKDPRVLQDFIASTLPQRCASITTIHLDLQFVEPPSISVDSEKDITKFKKSSEICAWDALASLLSLRNIQIRIHPAGFHHPDHYKALANLRQLREIQSLDKCRFYLPGEFLVEQWMLETPFEIVALDEWEWEHDWTRKPLLVF